MSIPYEGETDRSDFENIASLSENIVYRLPGCADVMVRKTIQEVYRDFCRRSCCLTVHEEQPVDGRGPCSVVVSPQNGGSITSVSSVHVGRRRLGSNDFSVRYGRAATVTIRPGVIHGRHACDAAKRRPEFVENDRPCTCGPTDVVRVTATEMPDLGSETAPSWFVQRHGDAVCHGVLARLMAMTGRTWSDASQAQTELVAYENAVNEEKTAYYGGVSSTIDASYRLDLI